MLAVGQNVKGKIGTLLQDARQEGEQLLLEQRRLSPEMPFVAPSGASSAAVSK